MIILGGVRFLNFLDQMSVAKVMRSSTLALLTLLAAARARKSAEVSIHWTVPSNFCFLAHPQKMHCLKDITRVHIYVRQARFRARWKKIPKMKKLHLVNTFFRCGLSFFIFSQERLQNFKKWTPKSRKKAQK